MMEWHDETICMMSSDWDGVEWSGGCHENEKKVVLICGMCIIEEALSKVDW